MILCIADLLTADELQQLDTWLVQLPYSDGRRTAGWHAQLVKNNEQADYTNKLTREADTLVRNAMNRHTLFQSATLPQSIQPLLFARYRESMTYGPHVDNAIMAGNTFRADIAVTVFLNPATDYDGGELVIDLTGGEQVYRLEAGQAIIYPANTLHQVTAVSRGERRVAVGWIQSLVRHAEQRNMLFDLDRTR